MCPPPIPTPTSRAHTPTPPEDGDNSPAALWEAARYALHWLVNLFGSPSEMAGWGVLAPRERVDVLGWLRPLEALVRALLVIKAADLPPAPRSARSAKRAASRPRRMVEQNPDRSEKWRVHFRALPPPPGPSSGRGVASAELPSAWPIAERLEAVIRVLENPDPFARRLAKRLHARPDGVVRVLGSPPTPRPGRPADWAHREAHAQALCAAAAFDTG